MTGRFDKFTERARKTLQLAQEEAQRFGHNYIGTEHILLGLVREGDGVAARVLYRLGVDLNKVRSSVKFIIGRGDRLVMGEIGLTPRSKRVIELAVDEARRLNHHYIGTEHLLLGLLREGEGIAAGVLESLGVSLAKVRAATMDVLQASQGDTIQSAVARETTDIFDVFTPRARKTLQFAQEEAQRYGQDTIVPEHFLLALLRESDGVAARVLQNLGVELGKVRAAFEFLTFGPERPPDAGPALKNHPGGITTSETGLAEDGKRVIELAVEESRRLNHHYIGTEHLLLALLHETDGTVAHVLESLGLSLDKVRAEVIEVLKSSSGYSIEGSGQAAGGPVHSTKRVRWSFPFGLAGAREESFDIPEVVVRERIRGFGFLPGIPEDDPRYDEARALRQWVDTDLDFGIVRHIDNSFLNVLRDALPISLLLARPYIGTDHMLAAMLRDNESAASRLLRQHQADLDGVYSILESGIGEPWSDPFTYEAMRSIRYAIEEARKAGAKATADHLLLGIILEGTSTAYAALARAGITAEEVRAHISGDNSPASE
jgi:ATP-dependent Clp protease ATP-binding subunit ClpA